MSFKKTADEMIKYLGFADWKWKRGMGGENHAFVNENGTQYIQILDQLRDNKYSCSVSAIVSLPALFAHSVHGRIVGDGVPPSNLRSKLLSFKVGSDGVLDPTQIEELKSAGPVAREFFEKTNSVEAANAEIDRLLEGGIRF